MDINDQWHTYSAYTYKTISGTFGADANGLSLSVYFNGQQVSTYKKQGTGYPNTNDEDTIYITVDGSVVCSAKAGMYSTTSINISKSNINYSEAGEHVVKLYAQCGDYVSCPYNYYHSAHEIASIKVKVYIPHQTPSISLSLPSGVNSWTKQGSSTSINYSWGSGDSHSHNIRITANGAEIANFNSSDGSGSGTLTYTTPGVDYRDRSYNVDARITDLADGNYNASATYTRWVWGLPSISVSLANSNKLLAGKANKITVNIGKLTNDSGATSTVWIEVNGTKVKEWTNQSTGATHTLTYDYTPPDAGKTYNIVAKVKHDFSGEIASASASFKTYVKPTVSDITGTTTFSPQNDISYTWTNNATAISNASETSEQKITIANSTIANKTDNNTSLKLAPSGTYWVQNIFDATARSVDVLSSKIVVALTNTSSGEVASKEKAFKVQYVPTQNISVVSIDNQGKTVSVEDVPEIKIKFKYPSDVVASGLVSGFKLKIYADGSYSDAKQVTALDLRINYSDYTNKDKVYEFAVKTETNLMRGVLNYASIVPYYVYPSNNIVVGGPTTKIGKLVKPYKKMAKPVISYPVNNTTWHNKQFRVLLRLNKDNDYDSYATYTKLFGGDNIQSAYKYSDVEIKVNNIVYAFSGKYTANTAHSEIFSSDVNKANTNNHQKYIAINPSLISSFADANKFDIQVRVQRGNYYFTDAEMKDSNISTWSDWSDKITLNKSAIVEQALSRGLEIKASHYQTVHNWGLRLLECYPLKSKDSRDTDRARADFIRGSNKVPDQGEYLGVYNTLVNLRTGVNNYCVYDRPAVKFNGNLPVFTPQTEIITSAKEGTDKYGSTGRNYINLMTYYMNEYLK